eukprot:245622-Pleurochrysis_carterae.AAC.1
MHAWSNEKPVTGNPPAEKCTCIGVAADRPHSAGMRGPSRKNMASASAARRLLAVCPSSSTSVPS